MTKETTRQRNARIRREFSAALGSYYADGSADRCIAARRAGALPIIHVDARGTITRTGDPA